MSNKVSKKVVTPTEYREAKKAANTLGLEFDKIEFYGTWTDKNTGEVCWPTTRKIVDDGRMYFKVEMDGEMCKIYSDDDDAFARIYFK